MRMADKAVIRIVPRARLHPANASAASKSAEISPAAGIMSDISSTPDAKRPVKRGAKKSRNGAQWRLGAFVGWLIVASRTTMTQ